MTQIVTWFIRLTPRKPPVFVSKNRPFHDRNIIVLDWQKKLTQDQRLQLLRQ